MTSKYDEERTQFLKKILVLKVCKQNISCLKCEFKMIYVNLMHCFGDR